MTRIIPSKLTSLGKTVAVGSLAAAAGCTVSLAPPVPYVYRPPPPAYVYRAPGYYAPGYYTPGYYAPGYAPAPVVVVAPQPVVVQAPPPSPQVDPALQQLVAPIALYPDPLIASLLPGCTYPDQVMAANQWVAGNPSASQADIDAQNWDPSIKALAHYPTVLNYMAGQPDWMRSLGSAFSENQANVFGAIQDLRAQAKNQGNLSNPMYLDVVSDGTTISIQPVNPTVIYVPTYDPVLVYQGPFAVVYGPSFVVGPWFVQGVDWDGGVVFVGDWHGGWAYGPGGWRRDPYFHDYGHHWGHDDRWGPRPFVDRGHWADRPEMRDHGGFRTVARAPARESHIRAQNQYAQTHNNSNGAGARNQGQHLQGGNQQHAQPNQQHPQNEQRGGGGAKPERR